MRPRENRGTTVRARSTDRNLNTRNACGMQFAIPASAMLAQGVPGMDDTCVWLICSRHMPRHRVDGQHGR
jgi:hypothetical protein